MKWIHGFIIDCLLLSHSPLYMSFSVSPTLPLPSWVLLSAVPKSIHSLHHYFSFELRLTLSLRSNPNMFGVLQPDSIRHGSLRATAASSIHLLLHNSHHYAKQHLAFIQLHSHHTFSTSAIILTSLFLCIVSHSCFTSEHLYNCIGNPRTNEDISCCDYFFLIVFSLNSNAFLFVEGETNVFPCSQMFHNGWVVGKWPALEYINSLRHIRGVQ